MPSKKCTVPERRDDLIAQLLGDEIVVYDGASHGAHSLNRATGETRHLRIHGFRRPLASGAQRGG